MFVSNSPTSLVLIFQRTNAVQFVRPCYIFKKHFPWGEETLDHLVQNLRVFNFLIVLRYFFQTIKKLYSYELSIYLKLRSEIFSEELAVVAKFDLICTCTGFLEKCMSLKYVCENMQRFSTY